jgi:hypothetical protein
LEVQNYMKSLPLEAQNLMECPHPLEILKRRLSDLQKEAEFISTAKLPSRAKNRTTNRTCMLLKSIWATAQRFGGNLTYNKHACAGKRGTFEEVINYLDRGQKVPIFSLPGWKIPPPPTLDRLRPRRQLHPHERRKF